MGTLQVPAPAKELHNRRKSWVHWEDQLPRLPKERAESGPDLQVLPSNLVGTFPKTAGKFLELGKGSQTSTTAMVSTHHSGGSTWSLRDPCTQQMPTEEAD